MEINEIKKLVLAEVKNKGIKEFEIYINLGRSLSIESKGGKIDSFEASETTGASLRVFSSGRQGFSYCTDFSNDAVKRMVDDAAMGSMHVTPDEFRILPESAVSIPSVPVYDARMKDIP